MKISARIAKLEMQNPAPMRWHNIIQDSHETFEQAVQRYGESRILPGDNLIVRKIVEVAA